MQQSAAAIVRNRREVVSCVKICCATGCINRSESNSWTNSFWLQKAGEKGGVTSTEEWPSHSIFRTLLALYYQLSVTFPQNVFVFLLVLEEELDNTTDFPVNLVSVSIDLAQFIISSELNSVSFAWFWKRFYENPCCEPSNLVRYLHSEFILMVSQIFGQNLPMLK